MPLNPLLPHYTGSIHPNCDYHHGQIFPARGVKCWQIARANRNPELDDRTGTTYKHAPDLTFWRGRFYVQYLTNPQGEHSGPGLDILASSADGAHWEDFRVSFPYYPIPACSITDYKGEGHTFDGSTFAFIHHRMCFYQSSDGRLLLLSFYGWSPHPWICNWDNYGIGRVVREYYPDGSMGEIYFILPCWQGGWTRELLRYPLYKECPDKGFVAACDELLNDRLAVQQWAEENGDRDPRITIKHPKGGKNEAFCSYHLSDTTVIGMWKHAKCARSEDGGESWSPVERCPSLVMSGQKVWAQRTSDGRFAMVYDPTLETQHRYPLCVTTSEDGLAFDAMRLVHGEVPPMRYEGFWKDMGPQYMRGICEGMETPPDGALWITYSVNKEDIWIARIPVPVLGEERGDLEEDFSSPGALEGWNLYSPAWARAELKDNALRLSDGEPCDYCKAERILRPAEKCRISLSLTPGQADRGCLYIEVCSRVGQPAVRLIFRADGVLYARTVAELPVCSYQAGQEMDLSLDIDCEAMTYRISIGGEPVSRRDGEPWRFMAAVGEVSRLILRTGPVRHTPTLDDIPDGRPMGGVLPGCETAAQPAVYDLKRVKTQSLYS